MKKKIAVLTGAGISAESGIRTFRDAGGLWEEHDIMEVASPSGWQNNPELVLEFYNRRRRQVLKATPNAGHKALVALEEVYDVTIITQNVDSLHEKAGSTKVLHLHGELLKVRSVANPELIYPWEKDLSMGDCAEDGAQLRPHIVWFGESVPMIDKAIPYFAEADIVLVIGTSMQVYPAAGLIRYTLPYAPIFYIDPHPNISHELALRPALRTIRSKASKGVPEVVKQLMKDGGDS